ncbi:hypothetical protein BDW75DRAFT_246487 [Aspergillus navahoensis]
MVVLGREQVAWRDPDSYLPLISGVLKVAHFMVVQKALWLDPQHMEIMSMWAASTEHGFSTGDAADDEVAMVIDALGTQREQEMAAIEADDDPDGFGNIADE